MTDKTAYELLPLNSPSKKVNKKSSYINGFGLIITQIFLRETYVKPKFFNKKELLVTAAHCSSN